VESTVGKKFKGLREQAANFVNAMANPVESVFQKRLDFPPIVRNDAYFPAANMQ